jgi:hypothetical protein
MDLDDLFNDCSSNIKYDVPENKIISNIKNFVEDVEKEFQGKLIENSKLDRDKEKSECISKISKLERELVSLKTPKVKGSSRGDMSKKIAEKRTKLRKEISSIKLKLDEIEIEEGSSGNSGQKRDLTTREKLAQKVKLKSDQKIEEKDTDDIPKVENPEKDPENSGTFNGTWKANTFNDLFSTDKI